MDNLDNVNGKSKEQSISEANSFFDQLLNSENGEAKTSPATPEAKPASPDSDIEDKTPVNLNEEASLPGDFRDKIKKVLTKENPESTPESNTSLEDEDVPDYKPGTTAEQWKKLKTIADRYKNESTTFASKAKELEEKNKQLDSELSQVKERLSQYETEESAIAFKASDAFRSEFVDKENNLIRRLSEVGNLNDVPTDIVEEAAKQSSYKDGLRVLQDNLYDQDAINDLARELKDLFILRKQKEEVLKDKEGLQQTILQSYNQKKEAVKLKAIQDAPAIALTTVNQLLTTEKLNFEPNIKNALIEDASDWLKYFAGQGIDVSQLAPNFTKVLAQAWNYQVEKLKNESLRNENSHLKEVLDIEYPSTDPRASNGSSSKKDMSDQEMAENFLKNVLG